MITSRRDYILRIIEEVGRLLARLTSKRQRGDTDDSALETVVSGLQRLLSLDADQVFLLTPDQHYEMLAGGDAPDFARDKLLLYAALNVEAGHIYTRQGKPALARATFLTALRFTLKTHRQFGPEGLPPYAPDVDTLLATLTDEPLDPATVLLIAEYRHARPGSAQTPHA